MENPGKTILAKGLLTCPECTVQREARLKAENAVAALTLALARSCKGVLTDPAGTFQALAGKTLDSYIAERRAQGSKTRS